MVSKSADFTRVGTILRRFGDIAFVVVSSLVAAGVILALLMLGSLEALLSSSYGQLILIKVTLVAVLLALAALNKFRTDGRRVVGRPRGRSKSQALYHR